jgi:ketosteroid isomerase-like protein
VSEENVEIHRRLLERINAGDIEGQLEFIHPDLEVYGRPDEPDMSVLHGHAGWRKDAALFAAVVDDYEFEVEEYIDAGEYLVVVGRPRGRYRSSGIRLEAMEDVERPSVWVWRFRDGKGIECRHFRTREEALEAAGLGE